MVLMIVRYFYFVGMGLLPSEANPPLVIDADAMLPRTIALEGFEAISRGSTQIAQIVGFVQVYQLAPGRPLDFRRELLGKRSLEDFFGLLVRETLDHALILVQGDNIVKR